MGINLTGITNILPLGLGASTPTPLPALPVNFSGKMFGTRLGFTATHEASIKFVYSEVEEVFDFTPFSVNVSPPKKYKSFRFEATPYVCNATVEKLNTGSERILTISKTKDVVLHKMKKPLSFSSLHLVDVAFVAKEGAIEGLAIPTSEKNVVLINAKDTIEGLTPQIVSKNVYLINALSSEELLTPKVIGRDVYIAISTNEIDLVPIPPRSVDIFLRKLPTQVRFQSYHLVEATIKTVKSLKFYTPKEIRGEVSWRLVFEAEFADNVKKRGKYAPSLAVRPGVDVFARESVLDPMKGSMLGAIASTSIHDVAVLAWLGALRTRIYRLLSVRNGAFLHAPGFGANKAVSSLIRPQDLSMMKLQIENELKKDRDVSACQVQVYQNTNSAKALTISATITARNGQNYTINM